MSGRFEKAERASGTQWDQELWEVATALLREEGPCTSGGGGAAGARVAFVPGAAPPTCRERAPAERKWNLGSALSRRGSLRPAGFPAPGWVCGPGLSHPHSRISHRLSFQEPRLCRCAEGFTKMVACVCQLVFWKKQACAFGGVFGDRGVVFGAAGSSAFPGHCAFRLSLPEYVLSTPSVAGRRVGSKMLG